MATVTLEIGDNRWPVACKDGEEARLEQLGAMIADRWADAQRASGNAGTAQALLLAALMLADDLADAKAAARAPGETAALDAIAERLESLATSLEKSTATT
ncbi:cell division protein ZapA [uncultured Sphingomonas sp.]|uniref:cell division protein ZapA n=1 Tax=uncultured Sphingomonas sp. TaxID=158754 RepID=UPI00260E88F3|nr:cell division protein ZapA [uncultured Sphingomonas sp.]